MATRKPVIDITTIEQLSEWLNTALLNLSDKGGFKIDLLSHVESIVSEERDSAYREGQYNYECTQDCCNSW